MAYWLNVFTKDTWLEFKAAGGEVTGFRARRWPRVQKVRIGDELLCYIAGLKRWVAVFEVIGSPFCAVEPRIWQSDVFPARIPVRIEIEVALENGVNATELVPLMPMFDGLR